MTLKVDVNKIKERLKAKSTKSFEAKDNDIFKALEPGKYNLRAVIYPHSQDPSSEPFLERHYHFGIPGGGTFYCPAKNENKKCHVCDFIWAKMKENKGNKEAIKKWSSFLPRLSVLVPVVVRGKEEDGVRFFRINSSDKQDRRSKNHDKLYEWTIDDDTSSWLDPNNGFDIVATYEEPQPGKASFLGPNVKAVLKDLELARKSTKFGTKEEYDNFVASVKNVDEEVFPKKSTEDSLSLLLKWREKLAPQAAKEVREDELNSDDGLSVSAAPDQTDIDDIDAKLSALDNKVKDFE